MDEARQRLEALKDAVEAHESWVPRILREFCYLQIRMLCEQIAVGCLIAHGEITNKRTLKNWSIPDVIRAMEEINPDFYPKPVVFGPNNQVNQRKDGRPYLSKAALVALWQTSGNYLHRGSAFNVMREDASGPDVDLDRIIADVAKIKNLLEQHIISSGDQSRHLIVALSSVAVGRRAQIWVATA